MSNNNEADGSDYPTEVAGYTDEELLVKERSKRRRKTGNVVGTIATAALATRSPGMWAAAGSSVKSLLNENSKHKIILQEMERRGLKPLKSDMKDAIFPVLTSAGGMFVGRAVGGPAGDSIGNYAGNLMHGIGNRAFGGSSKDKSKQVISFLRSKIHADYQESKSAPSSPAMAVARAPTAGPQATSLQTPSVYNIGHNETPPATIVYHYVPPSAEYPRGYYAPAPVQPSAPAPAPTPAPAYQATQPAPVQYAQPQVVYQQPQVTYQQPQITYQQPQISYQQPQTSYQQPQVSYQQSYQQPQTYQQPQGYQQPQLYAPQQHVAYQYAAPQSAEAAPAPGGLSRSATVYEAPPAYQAQPAQQQQPGLLRRARTMIERF
jgi:hypothetical protein